MNEKKLLKLINLIVLMSRYKVVIFKIKINFVFEKKKYWAIKKLCIFYFFTKHSCVDDIPAHLGFITTCVQDNKKKKNKKTKSLIINYNNI